MSKKIFEAGGDVLYGIAGDTENRVAGLKGVNPDLLQADGEKMISEPKTAPVKIETPPAETPAPKVTTPKASAPKTPDPAPAEPTGDPSGGLAAIPWKQIAIVAGAAGLLAALIALIRKCTKSIKLRFNKSVRTLARMQKDFTLNKKGLDMRAVLPGVGSRLNDFLTRAFSGSMFMNNGKTGVMGNTKSARQFKDGVIGLYPFCNIYKEEIRNDLTMAQTTFNKIKFAADSAENSNNKGNNNESVNGTVYRSFHDAFATERLNESKNGQVNESAIMALAALAPMVIRGGAFIVNKIKDGKADPKEAKTVQVTKQSTREICYAILNNFFEKYISFEQVSKKMGVDIKGLSDIDESTIDKFQAVLKKYQNPDGASVVKQYARVKGAYDKMLGHYLNIGNGIIKNFEKYTKADDEKHENLLVASKEKLQAMWDQQKDQYEHLFPYVLNEIINDGAYAQYIDFIIESVLPVFKTGIAGDADYVLDVMPKEGDYFLLSQTAQGGTIGNKAICKITTDYNKDTKNIGMSLVALYKGNTTLTPEGDVEVDEEPENFDTKSYKSDPIELEYNRFMALDPHKIVNMDKIIAKNVALDIRKYIGKDLIAYDKGLEPFKEQISSYNIQDPTAVIYNIKGVDESSKITYVIKHVATDTDIMNKLEYDEENNTYKGSTKDFQAIPEDSRKEATIGLSEINQYNNPVALKEEQEEEAQKYTDFTCFMKESDGSLIMLIPTVGEDNKITEVIVYYKNAGGNAIMQKVTLYHPVSKEDFNAAVGEGSELGMTFVSDANDKDDYLADFKAAKEGSIENKKEDKQISTVDLIKDVVKTLVSENGGQASEDAVAKQKEGYYISYNNNEQYFVCNKVKDGDGNVIGLAFGLTGKNINPAIGKLTFTDYCTDEQADNFLTDTLKATKDLTSTDTIAKDFFGKLVATEDFGKNVKQLNRIDDSAEFIKKFIERGFTRISDKNVKDEMKTYILNSVTQMVKILTNNLSIQNDNKTVHSTKTVHSLDEPEGDPGKQQFSSVDEDESGLTIDPVGDLYNAGQKRRQMDQAAQKKQQKQQKQIQKGRQENIDKTVNYNAKQAQSEQPKATDSFSISNEINDQKFNPVDESKFVFKDKNNVIAIFNSIVMIGNDKKEIPVQLLLNFAENNKKIFVTIVPFNNVKGFNKQNFEWTANTDKNKEALYNILDKSFYELLNAKVVIFKSSKNVNDSIKFNASYNTVVLESDRSSLNVNRKIEADKDCSPYYVLSECMWSCDNSEAVKRTLVNKMVAVLKNCRTKEGLMEYAKANPNVEFARNFAEMNYAVRKPANLYSTVGYSLFEGAVAVKFNDNNVISNAIGIGVNKIN